MTTGSPALHAIITPECRASRGDDGAWDEAVARAKANYDTIVAGWRESPVQPTLHLVLGIERPWVAWGPAADARACHHGVPAAGEHLDCGDTGGEA